MVFLILAASSNSCSYVRQPIVCLLNYTSFKAVKSLTLLYASSVFCVLFLDAIAYTRVCCQITNVMLLQKKKCFLK